MPIRDFFEGFAKQQLSPEGALGGALEGVRQERKDKLELAFLSKRIEMEREAKRLPLETVKNTFGLLSGGVTPEQERRFPGITGPTGKIEQEVYNPLFQGARSAFAAKAKVSVYRQPTTVFRNVGNSVEAFTFDRSPGREGTILKRETVGINPAFQKEASSRVAAYSSADVYLDQIEDSLDQVLASGTALDSYPKGLKTELSVLVQNNDPAALHLTRLMDFYILQLTALVSGKQMAARELEAIKKALPKTTDTLENAVNLLRDVRTTYDGAKKANIEAFLLGPSASVRKERTERFSNKDRGYVESLIKSGKINVRQE